MRKDQVTTRQALDTQSIEMQSSSELRVVLVNGARLDPDLRRDRDIELVRVPSTLDAIAEIGMGSDDIQNVVVLPGNVDLDDQAYDQFQDAVHLISPAARVMTVSSDPSVRQSRLVITPQADADAIRSALNQRRCEKVQTQAPSVKKTSSASNPPVDAAQLRADQRLVQLLMQGADITSLALDIARHMLDDPAAKLEPAGSNMPGVDMKRAKHSMGKLVALPGPASTMTLEQAGSWLSDWLALNHQHAQLKHAAMTDPLTGAFNRRYFTMFLESAIGSALKAKQRLSILLFDIDNFKAYNDSFSHAAGDEILIHTVQLLKSVIRPEDKVCRIGGDEFVVIFHEPQGPRDPASSPLESVFDIAVRFQKQICQHRFPKLSKDAPGKLTISGGMATCPWDGRTINELLDHADERLRASKSKGKNVITFGPNTENNSACKCDEP